MSDKKKQAKVLLTHYFRTATKGPWDYNSDNQAEIEEIVDLIVAAAVEEVKAELKKATEEDEAGSYAEYKQQYGGKV